MTTEGYLKLRSERVAYRIDVTGDVLQQINSPEANFVSFSRIRKDGSFHEMLVPKSEIVYVQLKPKDELDRFIDDKGITKARKQGEGRVEQQSEEAPVEEEYAE